METLYGEVDPARVDMRALLRLRQNNRPVGDYISDFQQAVARFSLAGSPTEHNQILYFIEHMDESLQKSLSVNPVDFEP